MNSAQQQQQHLSDQQNAIAERFYKSRSTINSIVQAEKEASIEQPRITVVKDLPNAKKKVVAQAGQKHIDVQEQDKTAEQQPSFLRQLLTDVTNTFDDDDDSGSVIAEFEPSIARSARSKPQMLEKDTSWTDMAAELVQDFSTTFDQDDDIIDDAVPVVHPPSASIGVDPAPSMLEDETTPRKVQERTYVTTGSSKAEESPSLWQNLMGLVYEVGNTF